MRRPRWSYENIIEYMESKGSTLLTTKDEYNEQIKAKIRSSMLKITITCIGCDNGIISNAILDNMVRRNGYYCKECLSKEKSKRMKNLWNNDEFKSKMCEVGREFWKHSDRKENLIKGIKKKCTDPEYINKISNRMKVTVVNIWRDENFVKRHKERAKIKWTGTSNPRYKPYLTEEDRRDRRGTALIKKWRLDVFHKDNFTCKHCGDDKGGNLEAHHLDSWNWAKDSRYDPNNGVTLCSCCHKEFHDIFGYGNNTSQQFNEWL